MSTLPSNKGGRDKYYRTIDVESSDSEFDEPPLPSSERLKDKAKMNVPSIRSAQKDRQRAPATTIINPSNSSSPSTGKLRPQDTPVQTPRPSRTRAAEFRTPIKGPTKPAGTPLGKAIEKEFEKLIIGGASPSKEPKPRPIVVDVESDDDVSTDVEAISSPERPSYSHGQSFGKDSSYSSLNSLFSPQAVSAASSFSSVSSSSEYTKSTSMTATPARVKDVFDISQSDNVTTRRTPKIQPQASQKTRQVLPVVVAQQSTDAAVVRFAQSQFCEDLEHCVIAHCDDTQKLLDSNMIAWGTQFELARGVSNGVWTWADVQTHARALQGKSTDSAYKVQRVLRGQSHINEPVDISLWKELDREQDAILENISRGLGLMGEFHGVKNWYGGQIQQLARLIRDGTTYKVVIEPMEKRRSNRFARFYGSRRFIQLRIPDDILQKENAQVKKYITRGFVLCGRIFVPFHSKEGSVYLVETDQNCGRSTERWCGDQFRMSFREFMNWHNPLVEIKNCNQTISKYATRFSLGLSNSVPALEFEENNIMFIDDITAKGWPKDKHNAPADKLMTDGCGFINHAALRIMIKNLGWESLPAGVQGRIDGAKGFWILHPDDTSDIPKIWIRHSQDKIKNSGYDRAHRIFDLLGPSRPSPSITLTAQSITNIFSNGIPANTLIRLMEEGLENEVAPLMEWDRPHAMVFLWDAINKCGNVTGSRTQRLAVSRNRALGLKGRDRGRDNEAMDSEATDSQVGEEPVSIYTGRNQHSGAPLGLHEIATELVQAGFHPAESRLLFDKVRYIVQTVIKTSVEKYRIPILESLGAYIIPDPIGVLKKGEIYYRFSKPRKDPRTDMLVHVLEGPVLLGRYPIRLPSDMKKVIARDYRELHRWSDVCIISTEGDRSLANELAGGDMDGDEIIAIWAPELVAAFQNQPLTEEPKDLITANFESKSTVESVQSFCHKNSPGRGTSEAFLRHLIANLSDSQVGLYSMMHENAVVTYGYDHPESIRLAFIFSTLLDASKTGHRLRHGVAQKDLKKYGNSAPEIASGSSQVDTRDILKRLKSAAIQKGADLFEKYEAKKPVKDGNQDKDLRRPYDDAVNHAQEANNLKITTFVEELSRIRNHVYAARDLFNSACSKSANRREQQSPVKGGKSFGKSKSNQGDLMLACAKAYMQPIENIILFKHTLETIKASFAYQVSDTFAFTVAFRELCRIKVLASATGDAPSLRMFDDAKAISSSYLRALRVCDEDEENIYA